MSEARSELRVDGWKGYKPNMPSDDMLPVVVYLCLRCGKIEFAAYQQQRKDLQSNADSHRKLLFRAITGGIGPH